jgi:small-conductance mechanosensitive channel
MDIWRAFRKTGIEIPFPQRDLHVKQLPQLDEWLRAEGDTDGSASD